RRGQRAGAARSPGRGRERRAVPRRPCARGREASERRPAAALLGRRGRGGAEADRVRRVELRGGGNGGGRAAGRGAPGRVEARGPASPPPPPPPHNPPPPPPRPPPP